MEKTKAQHDADSIYIAEHVCRMHGHSIEVWIDGEREVIICTKCGLSRTEIHEGEVDD